MYKASTLTLVICCLGIVVIAWAKFTLPEFGFFSSGLVLIILLTIFIKNDDYTKIFGVLSMTLILVSLLLPHGRPVSQAVVPQTLGASVALLSTIIVLYIKKLTRSIENERAQMNALFEHATEGIVLIRVNGSIVLANPELLRLFGYTIGELLGQPIEILIPPRFHRAHATHRKAYFNQPSNRKMAHGRSLFALRKNGEEFPVHVNLSYYTQNNENFAVAFVTDITERRQSEDKLIQQKEELEKVTLDIQKINAELENKVEERTLILQEALQELERSQLELNEALTKEIQLNEIKSRFVSMASHEFRTPLSTVLSSAALLSKYTLTEQQANREKHIRRIKESVKHLNELLEDFLSLGKLEEGKVETNASGFGVTEFLNDILDEMRSTLKQGQHFHTAFEGDDYFVTDKRLLKNVLINLVSNAIKFSDEGKPISVTVNNREEKLVIQVKDEGIGIAAEDTPFLFSTFYRGKNVFNIQGTGLGLHIIKRYLELLEGEITFTSELNRGTTFTVQLPLLKEAVVLDKA